MRSTDALVGVLFMSTATLYWVTEVRTPRHVSRVPTVGQGRGLEEGSHLHTDSDIDAALRRHGGIAPPPPASELVHIKEVVKGDTTFEETIKHHRVRPTPLLIPIRNSSSGLTCPGCRHPHSPLQRTSLWITPHLHFTAITPPATLVILNMSLPRAWKAGWSSSSCPLSLLSATRCPLALRRSREGGRKGERGREREGEGETRSSSACRPCGDSILGELMPQTMLHHPVNSWYSNFESGPFQQSSTTP
jgi:hypothetical protein